MIMMLSYYKLLPQSARRGAKSAMISAHLAGGDCLNVGCVPVCANNVVLWNEGRKEDAPLICVC